MIDPDTIDVHFRPLRHDDLRLLHRWLNTPHVLEWWDNPGPTYQQVMEKYSPRILRQEHVHPYIMLLGNGPIGYIQVYEVEEDSPYAPYLPNRGRAFGVDLFIGEWEYVHRGSGGPMLQAFVDQVVFGQTNADMCVVDPAENNRVAIRAYEKAGFQHSATFQQPDEEDPTFLMLRERPSRQSGGDEPGAETL